jgi:lysophospholipase L1-like esterase
VAPDEAAHQAALDRVVAGARLAAGSDPFAFIDSGDAPPWRFVPLVPDDAAASLAAVWRRASARPVRVAMYGASGTAADTHTASLRGYLQHRFGDGGPGWIPLGKAKRWSRHTEATIVASKGWTAVHAVREGDGGPLALAAGGLGFDGSRKGVRVSLTLVREQPTPLDRFELVVLAQPGGGRVRVAVDGGAAVVHATAADAPRLSTLPLRSSSRHPRVALEVVGDGPVRVFGIIAERERGVVVDTLGVDGARARNWRRWDDATWAAAIAARPPDVVTLAYGTNEAADADVDTRRFEDDFTAMLVRVRAQLPDAVCVVLGPGDFPVERGSGFVPRPCLAEIAALQRTLARSHGCAFWDELAFMGGPGSMTRWVHTKPPAARDDHLHFTPLGAAIKGHYLAQALVLGTDAGL